MQKPTDERLIAYLDGELDGADRAEMALVLEQDEALRERAALLSESAGLLRAAFDAVLHEPLPDRLIAAARGPGAAAVSRNRSGSAALALQRLRRNMRERRRWWIGVPVAASLACLLLGTGVGYFAANQKDSDRVAQYQTQINLASGNWLDSIAGYHKLFVNAGSNDSGLADVPPSDHQAAHQVAQKLPHDFRLPNLKPWGLVFQGARFIIIDGRQSVQLFYTTTNKALGPLTVIVGSTGKGDLAPTFDRRDDVNMLYWRHHGHAYALVGTADVGYLWNVYKDIAWQMDAI